ncbi:MAG: T9SS type A sorting domain-containing protein [Fibrobacteria bacterium]|nr:T9SS type A sorting domain-containing protein [Fibrobacteria bacterium]
MKRHSSIIMTTAMIYLLFLIPSLHAGLPKNGLVMMDLQNIKKVTSKHTPDDTYLSFEEVVEAGINGLNFNNFTGAGDNYTYSEWVKEAHEYGLWVAGGNPGDLGKIKLVDIYARSFAGHQFDFVTLNAPWNHQGCGEWSELIDESFFNSMKIHITQVNPDCKVLISDYNCNSNFNTWGGVNGLIQQTLMPGELNTNLTRAQTYKTNTGKFTGSWVWMGNADYNGSGASYSDADFNTTFESVYNNLGNVFLTRYKSRTDCNWNARVAEIKKMVGNKAVTLPVWKDFSPSEEINRSAPDCQVQVRCESMGLNPESVECYYTNSPVILENTKWIRHTNVSATGSKGTKEWITITAKSVPFNKASGTLNRVMFKIKDTYTGTWYRSAHTVKREYTVKIGGRDWEDLENGAVVNSLPATLSVKVKHPSGIDENTLACEYSTDRGQTWTVHAGSTIAQDSGNVFLVTATGVPFIEDKAMQNKIRFTIKTKTGDILKSEEYAVKVMLAPVLSNIRIKRNAESDVDIEVDVQDESGLRIGTQPTAPKEETVALYHFDGNVKDASGNGYDGVLQGDPPPKLTTGAAWQPEGVQSYLTCVRKNVNNANMGHGTMGLSQEFTLSFWQVDGGSEAQMGIGDNGMKGSLHAWWVNNIWMFRAWKDNHSTADDERYLISLSKRLDGWMHMVLTFDGRYARTYANGQFTGKADWNGFFLHDFGPLMIGSGANTYRSGGGSFDEVHLINRALTPAEIASEYFSGMYRYSADDGTSWSAWEKAGFDKTDSTTEKATMSLTGLSLSGSADSTYKLQLSIRDINGNTALREYVINSDSATVPARAEPVYKPEIKCAPNPFYNQTNIAITLKHEEQVEIKIFSIGGNLVCRLISGFFKAGNHDFYWDGTGKNGLTVPVGQYFASIKTGNKVVLKKLIKLQ